MGDSAPLPDLTAPLRDAVLRVGRDRLISRGGLCRNVLKDLFPDQPLAVSLLVAAVEEGGATALDRQGGTVDAALLVPRLASELARSRGLTVEHANWAVHTWARALDVAAAPTQLVEPSAPVGGTRPAPPPVLDEEPTLYLGPPSPAALASAAPAPAWAAPSAPLGPAPGRPRRNGRLVAAAAMVVVVVSVVVVFIVTGGAGQTPQRRSGATPGPSVTSSASTTATTSTAISSPASTSATATATSPDSVTFNGVTVGRATDLTRAPTVSSRSAAAATGFDYRELVVGKGTTPTLESTVTVQYTGVLYKNGAAFDSSWTRGEPAQFSLKGVVPGFTEGVAGGPGVNPMHTGGRRLIILPAKLAYGAQANGSIPANADLVFVVDLISIDG